MARGQHPQTAHQPETLNSHEMEDRSTDGAKCPRLLPGLRMEQDWTQNQDWPMAVRRRSRGEETWTAHKWGKVTGLACVAQATKISQAGAPVGTCNPSVGTERWHLSGAGSGRFPGG